MLNTIAISNDSHIGCQELSRAAVSQVITDTGFQLPTEPSRNALTCAEKLLEWLDNNKTQWWPVLLWHY